MDPMNLSAPLGDARPLDMSEADFAEWLPNSKRGIGGSGAAALLGVNPYQTPLDVWNRIFGVGPEDDGNHHTLRGTALEDDAAAEFVRKFDRGPKPRKLVYPGGFAQHPRFPWLVGHPDGIVTCLSCRPDPGVWECKVPDSDNYRAWVETGMPPYYVVQGNHYANILDYHWGQFCVFDPLGWDMHVPEFVRDAPLVEQIEEVSWEFWQRHVLTRIPPDAIQPVATRVSVPTVGKTATVLRDPRHLRVLDQYIAAHEQRKLAERVEADLRAPLERLMTELETDFVIDGKGRKVYWREQRAMKIKADLVRSKLSPEQIESVTAEEISRPMKPYY